MVKEFAAVNNTVQIRKLLKVLGQDFATSQNTNTKKGGLIGLAATAVALGKVWLLMFLITTNCNSVRYKSYNTNNQIHSVHTRFKTNLHPPIANLTKFQKGVYYSGIKIFNNLSHGIKDLANEITLFRNALKRFLIINSFYNSEECFNYQR
jgi:hypothetical protein